MLDAHPDLTKSVLIGLGWYYLILFGMNMCWTVRSYRLDGHFGRQHIPVVVIWAAWSVLLLMVAIAHFNGLSSPENFQIRLPGPFKSFVDENFADPVTYFVLSVGLFAAMVFMGLSLTDWDFRQIVGKPDNVPIVSMLFIVAFFTWIYFRRAVENDRRIAEGRRLCEQDDNEKVLVWPDLVYTELICMVVLTAVLVFWGIALQAPLEEPASSVKTPNPSKAPWYFLGLQEMLVYFDPWLAGVVLPSIILVGLMAIPYIDFNRKGNGYFTYRERSFAITTFMFGYLPLWSAMIILGTFLRGPNWNFFGIYEYWDVHKLVALNNVNLSEYFWVYSQMSGLYGGLPTAPSGAGGLEQFGYILLREAPGIIVVAVYFGVLPGLMAVTIFRTFFVKMGFMRFMVFSNLVLWMAILPVKMVLRWTVNLKYLVAIPEYFFNI